MALFSGDSMWYRARIIGLPGNRQVDVHYVDFGNSERVSIFNCRKILDGFLVLPSQALCCSLTDVEPIDAEEGWSENVSADIHNGIHDGEMVHFQGSSSLQLFL